MKKIFSVMGMTCAACAAHVERAVKKLGAENAEVSLLLNRLTVDTDIADADIVSAVRGAGYDAAREESGADGTAVAQSKTAGEANTKYDYSRKLLWRLLSSLLFIIPLMYFSMGHRAGFPMGALDPHRNPASFALIQAVLTAPVLVINGRFFVGGAKSIARRAPNMDALVALGSGAAFVYGMALLFVINARVAAGDTVGGAEAAMSLFFESAAMILTLVTLGKFLESKSKGKTRAAVDKLLRLRPQTVTVERDGKAVEIPIEAIRIGDRVIVLPGEYIPCDGTVTDGATTLDKSAITGESVPEEVTVGASVTSAALNLTGRIVFTAEKVGADTTLSKIIELVENAGGSKAPIQKIADRVSAVFVPTVCAIALVTLIVWLCIGSVGQALTMAISVLVISCPCALGLATPVAVMAGTGRAAAHGVLVKNAEVLQRLGGVRIVALDKTATVTEGVPRVVDIKGYGAFAGMPEKVLTIAAALERTSTHPLAHAIVRAEDENGNDGGKTALVPSQSEYRIGYGVIGVVDGTEYALGGARLCAEFGVEAVEDGAQTVFLCAKGELLGAITVEDEVKPTSKRAVELLKSVGVRVAMITGDNEFQARRTAEKVGITEVYHSVLPDRKLEIVNTLKAQGTVAMVGDGINDAPALKAADVGIAIGSGTDVAIEAADVVLVKSDLLDVPRAMSISHASLRNIKQNLFWAFIYNILGIPLAAGVLYAVGVTLNPMIAAGAMAFSSLFVVCNALRLTVMRFDDKRLPRKLHKLKHAQPDKSNNGATADNKGDNCMKTVLNVRDMSCMHCVRRVETALKAVEGVTDVTVELEQGIATVSGDFDKQAAVAAVTAAGYPAEIAE